MTAAAVLLFVGLLIAGVGAWLINRAHVGTDGDCGAGLLGVMACFVAFLIVLVALLRLWVP